MKINSVSTKGKAVLVTAFTGALISVATFLGASAHAATGTQTPLPPCMIMPPGYVMPPCATPSPTPVTATQATATTNYVQSTAVAPKVAPKKVTPAKAATPKPATKVAPKVNYTLAAGTVSYTHLTLPTNREV